MARSGTEISQSMIGKSGAAREAIVWGAISNNEMPSWMNPANWPIVLVNWLDKDLIPHTLVMNVSPRYIEVGTDVDPFMAPMQPDTAQRSANKLNAILPSQKIVDDIWRWSVAKLPIAPPKGFKIPGPDMTDVRSWIAYNTSIQKALNGSQAIMAGGKKDVVIGPKLDGSRVAIYSTPFSGSGELRKSGNYQPYSTIHTIDHVDYSHGVRLISRKAKFDGEDVDLKDIFENPKTSPMVSDQGSFSPFFPNSGSKATYGVNSGSDAFVSNGPIVNPPPRSGENNGISLMSSSYDTKSIKGITLGALTGVGVSWISGLTLPLTVGFGIIGAILGKRIADKVL